MSDDRDLEIYLDEKRRVVEDGLETFLAARPGEHARLQEAMRYSVFSGGKRLRPILAIAAYEIAGGVAVEGILAPACATELVHTYSLVHDDLPAMDDDAMRRGKPSNHAAYGDALAILAGDALLTLAFDIVASAGSIRTERRALVLTELARANGWLGMVGGQAADIEGEGAVPSVEAVEFIHLRKTAMPIAAAVRIGGIAAGAPPGTLEGLSAYGRAIGLAFQITDDILDIDGTAEAMGKAVGKDLARGKMTYPGVVGIEAARARVSDLVDGAVCALAPFGERAWALRAIAAFIRDRRH